MLCSRAGVRSKAQQDASRLYSGIVNAHGAGHVFQGDRNVGQINDTRQFYIGNKITVADATGHYCLESSSSFETVEYLVRNLATILGHIQRLSRNNQAEHSWREDLVVAEQKYATVQEDLRKIRERWSESDAGSASTLERGEFSCEIRDFRTRIKADTSWFTMKYTEYTRSLESSKLQQKLEQFIKVRRRSRETSVFSTTTSGSMTPGRRETWRQIRKEMQYVGITPEIFNKNKSQIVSLLRADLPNHELEDIEAEEMDLNIDMSPPDGIEELSDASLVQQSNSPQDALKTLVANSPHSNHQFFKSLFEEIFSDEQSHSITMLPGSMSRLGHWPAKGLYPENPFISEAGLQASHCTTMSIQEAISRAQFNLKNRRFYGRPQRMLRGIITASWPIDDNALDSVLTIINKDFFHGALSGRVVWQWSRSSQLIYDRELLSSTALRRIDDKGGYETSIILSDSILRNIYPARNLLLNVFLHELIQCYLFISCGFESPGRDGYSEAIGKIAAIIETWVDDSHLNLRSITTIRKCFRGEWPLEESGACVEPSREPSRTELQSYSHSQDEYYQCPSLGRCIRAQVIISLNRLSPTISCEHRHMINRDTNVGLGKDPFPTCVNFGMIESTPGLKAGVFIRESIEIREIINPDTLICQRICEVPCKCWGYPELPIYKAFNHTTQTWLAVKACYKPQNPRRQYSERITLQVEASEHPNIVPIVTVIDDLDYIYVVMDYYPDGDLFDHITQGRTDFTYNFIRRVFIQLLDAVEHCHRLGIYHMDLKPENILFSGDSILLTGFGLARRDFATFYSGTHEYISPENWLSKSTNMPFWPAPNDIWALGIILVNLAFKCEPWRVATLEDPSYTAFRRDSNYLKTKLPLSDEFHSLLCLILEPDPGRRITIGELRRHFLNCPRFTA